MAEATVQICLRGDTAANWAAANPVLAKNEVGLVEDTKRRKVGDGVTPWNELGYEDATLLAELGNKLDRRAAVSALSDTDNVGFATLHEACAVGGNLQSNRRLLRLLQSATLLNSTLNLNTGGLHVNTSQQLTLESAALTGGGAVSGDGGSAVRIKAGSASSVVSGLSLQIPFILENSTLILQTFVEQVVGTNWAQGTGTIYVDQACYSMLNGSPVALAVARVDAGITIRPLPSLSSNEGPPVEAPAAITQNTANFYTLSDAAAAFAGFSNASIKQTFDFILTNAMRYQPIAAFSETASDGSLVPPYDLPTWDAYLRYQLTQKPIVSSGGSTTAATPTGSFNPQNRIYSVNSNYPTSRLLVSINYSSFTQATSNTYQIDDNYHGEGLYRVKVSALGSEQESAVLFSQAFPAKATGLVDIPTGLQGYLQSNGTGFAHRSQATAAQQGPFSLGLINNFQANALQSWQLGVNDQGILRSYLESVGVTNPIYQDGFGMDAQYMARVQASGVRELIIKKDARRPVPGGGSDGSGFGKWDEILYAHYKEEILQAFANANAMGFNPVVNWILLDVKEAEANNPNFATMYHERINRFEADGLITPQTKRLISMGYCAAYYDNVRALQEQLYQLDPSKYVKIDIGLQQDIGDYTHLAHVGQTAEGNAVYDATHGGSVPPVEETNVSATNWLAMLFPTRDAGFSYANGVFTTSAGGQFDHKLLDDHVIRAGEDGRFLVQYASTAGRNAAVGMNKVNAKTGALAMPMMFFIGNGGNLVIHASGTPVHTTYMATLGRYYCLRRSATGRVTVEESADKTNWKVVYAFTVLLTGAVYLVADLFDNTTQLQQPQSLNALLPGQTTPDPEPGQAPISVLATSSDIAYPQGNGGAGSFGGRQYVNFLYSAVYGMSKTYNQLQLYILRDPSGGPFIVKVDGVQVGAEQTCYKDSSGSEAALITLYIGGTTHASWEVVNSGSGKPVYLSEVVMSAV